MKLRCSKGVVVPVAVVNELDGDLVSLHLCNLRSVPGVVLREPGGAH